MAASDDGMQAPKFGVGQPVRRVEDARFLRGAGAYVDDLTLNEQLYAAFVRSPYAHARVTSVDLSAARAASGVAGAYAYPETQEMGLQEFGDCVGMKNADGTLIAPVKAPHLAKDRVRFVGQPIAMIVADSPGAAKDAAELVEVDFEELPVAMAPGAEGAPQIHDAAPGNIAYRWELGDAAACDAAFASAAHVVKTSAPAQRLAVVPMEPRAVNAEWDPDLERWTVHCTTQGSHGMRARLSEHLGVEPDRIRVLTPDVGGGFGMKLMVHPEYALCAAAARALGRPVKWTSERGEAFLSDAQGRSVDIEAEGAFDAEGRMLAIRFNQISDIGAHYCQFSAGIHSMFSVALTGGLYDVGAAYIKATGAFTNKTPMDAYRGAGRPEANYATELLLDAAAREIGLDQAEIRFRNLRDADAAPFRTATGMKVDSADCKTVLKKALDQAAFESADERKKEASSRGMLRGIGVSCYVERTGGPPLENARIRVRSDGRMQAWVGTQSTGQGHETAWSQIIHEKLGVDIDRIDFPAGDSDLLPAGGGTGGSRSLIMGYRVFVAAADDVIEKGREAAAQALEASPVDIEFSAEEGGVFRVAGTDRTIDLFAAAGHAKDDFGETAILGLGGVSDTESSYPNGAHVVEVEVDPETGATEIVDYVIVDDFGVILNPLLAAGQVHGGVVQGIGQALLEQTVFDVESGQPLTGSFMDYAMPRAHHAPRMRSSFYEGAPCTTNPLGSKGAGESGSVGATQAVVLAVLDALRPLGVDRLTTPLTPLKLWTAIQEAKS